MRTRVLLSLLLLAGCVPAADDAEDAALDAELTDESAPVYPHDRAHSPLTPEIVSGLRRIVAAGGHRDRVFAKIGDSITVSSSFAQCFVQRPVLLSPEIAPTAEDDQAALEAARQLFASTIIGGATSFNRTSLAATVGWSAARAIQGTPDSPIDREVTAIDPAFAIVMLGTNDTYAGSTAQYRRAMTKIVDRLLARNVVPILSTIPPRLDPKYDALVPGMNSVVRTIAEQKRVPLMDLWLRLRDVPGYGLDPGGSPPGVHPNVRGDGCDFGELGLTRGYNQRNLLLIEALDRMKRFVLDAAPAAPDPAPTPEPSPTDPGSTDPGCFSYTLQRTVFTGTCVQSVTDRAWYQCTGGAWRAPVVDGIGPGGACAAEHPL